MSARHVARAVGLLVLLAVVCTTPAAAQDPAQVFRQQCASCHTIGGGRLTGPDLKGVTARADRAWLVEFLANPQAMIDRGDPYALRLVQEARGVIMPPIPGMTPALAQALLDLIEAESALEKSQFAGTRVSDRPFTPADVERGRQIFHGTSPLAAGGPACISCHTVRGAGGLGGGSLGPDLTRVYERLQGRQGLTSWLSAPPTPTMGRVYATARLNENEILPLVAYFERAAQQGGEDDRAGAFVFALLGIGGSAAGLVLFDAIWRTRFRSVRRALVERFRLRRA